VIRIAKPVGFIALMLTVALTAASCSSTDNGGVNATQEGSKGGAGGGAPGAPAKGGTLVDLQNFATGEQDHLDPALASTLQSAQIPALLYDGLTEFDFTDSAHPVLKPDVAENFSSNEKGDEWTFNLRKDTKFSDGSTVKPSDFKYAWEQVLNPTLASDLTYHMDIIKGAKEIEDGTATELSGVVADDAAGTLKISLTNPFADFAGTLSHIVFSPKPKAVYQAMSDKADWEKTVMIGNGPFKMKQAYTSGDQQLTLVRNDSYFGGIEGHQAYLDEIQFKISKDIDSAYADFEAGNGQTAAIPSGKYAEATGKYPHDTDASLGLYYFAINQEDPLLGGPKNLKLRQAISLAVDRQGINKAVYDGSRRMPTGLTPPGLPGFKAGLCGDYCPESPKLDQAKQLMSEWKAAGGNLNGPVKIQFNAGSGHEDVVNVLVTNLRDIGVEATPDPRDAKTYFKEMRQGGCQICRSGWIWDYPIYDNGVFALTHSSSVDKDNLARYKDAEVDKAIGQARETLDADKRAEYYQTAEKRSLDAMVAVPINWYASMIVYTDQVQDFVATPLQFVLYQNVWIKS